MELIWRDDQEHKRRWGMAKRKNSSAKKNGQQNESDAMPSGNHKIIE